MAGSLLCMHAGKFRVHDLGPICPAQLQGEQRPILAGQVRDLPLKLKVAVKSSRTSRKN